MTCSNHLKDLYGAKTLHARVHEFTWSQIGSDGVRSGLRGRCRGAPVERIPYILGPYYSGIGVAIVPAAFLFVRYHRVSTGIATVHGQ